MHQDLSYSNANNPDLELVVVPSVQRWYLPNIDSEESRWLAYLMRLRFDAKGDSVLRVVELWLNAMFTIEPDLLHPRCGVDDEGTYHVTWCSDSPHATFAIEVEPDRTLHWYYLGDGISDGSPDEGENQIPQRAIRTLRHHFTKASKN
jgi:hypothetical protein